MASSVLFAQRRLGAGASNAMTLRGANVGVGTNTPTAKMDVRGDAIITGIFTDSNYNPIVGAIANWLALTPAPAFGVAETGAVFTYSQATGRFRGSGNEVVYNVNLGATVTTAALSTAADFTIPLPYIYGDSYASNAILGEMWLSVAYGSLSNVFKALARANPEDTATAKVRFLSGTTELGMGSLAVGATVNLQGTLLYTTSSSTRLMPPTPATVTAQTITSNLAPVFGSGFTWRPTASTPTLTVPDTEYPASYFIPSASAGQVRYLGTDVSYQIRLVGSIQTQPAGDSNYLLSLPYPADLTDTYPADSIVGELWLSVTTAETLATPGGSNNFKAFARTIAGSPDAVAIRVLSGTTEDTLASLTVDSLITLQGTLNYETTTVYNGDVYTSYLPPVFSQDFAGQVTVNGSGYPPRGQLDIIGTGTSTQPALVVDARGTDNAIAEFRSGGNVVVTIGRDGMFYDSNKVTSFLPSGMVQWVSAAAPSVVPGIGGSLSNISGSARYKYGGNSVAYQFERTFAVTGTSPSPVSASNYTLTLPYALNAQAYPSTSNTVNAAVDLKGVSIGGTTITITNAAGTVSTTFSGYAKTIPDDAANVQLRYLNGTTDSTLSEFAAGSRVTVTGSLEYASLQMSSPLLAYTLSNVFNRDTDGRVSIGTEQVPRARLDIGETSATIPALIVESTGGSDVLRLRTAATAATEGDASVVVNANGNVGIGTTIPQGRLDVRATAFGSSGATNGAGVVLIDSGANVGIGTTLPSAGLHVTGSNVVTAIKVDQKVTDVEFPPLGASNIGAYADYTDSVASIDVGSPMTLVEFPPVGLTSATLTAGPITIGVSGAFYGNGNYVVTASSVFDGNYPPWRVFDKQNGLPWLSSTSYSTTSPYAATSGGPTIVSSISYTGAFLQIQLPTAIILKSYLITPSTSSFTNWIIAGSIDGSTWSLVHSQQGRTWNLGVEILFTTQNTLPFLYYRIIILNAAENTGTVAFREWKLFADIPLPTTAREYPPLPMTANTTYLNGTYGEGTYVASASSASYSAHPEYLAFNKGTSGISPDFWHSAGSTYTAATGAYIGTINTYDSLNNKYSGEWLQLYLPQPFIVSYYTLWPRLDSLHTMRNPTTFWILASTDGLKWILLNSQSGIVWSTTPQTFNVTATLPYSYYRIVTNIVGNSGVTTFRDSVQIAEWKLFGTQSAYPKYRTALPATAATYSTGTYATYANSIYNATTVDAAPPLFLTDKTLTAPWRTGASNYTSGADASPIPSVFFELPAAIRLTSYTMTAPDTSEAPSAWSLYGSNMNVAGGWLLLDARTSVVSPWTVSLTQTFATATSAFNFFKFDFLRNCASAAPGDFIGLAELRLGGDDTVSESRIAVGPDGRVGINTPSAEMNANSALTVSGNMTVAGSINAGNLGMFRNRIINGDMRIDQRRAGALNTITAANVYMTDRWMVHDTAATAVLTAQQVRAPANPYGQVYALSAVVTTAQASLAAQEYCGFEQRIEGFNVDDLMWGSQYAQPITVSFAAYSTLAGTYSLALRNATNTASYVSAFSVPVANQWVRVEKTIPGETQATWAIDNTLGLALNITLASGANWQTADINRWANSSRASSGFGFIAATGTTNFAATVNSQFFLTGVQVEKGTLATEFERRPYGIELGLCQRYYIQYKNPSESTFFHIGCGFSINTVSARITLSLPISLRTMTPVITMSSGTGALYGSSLTQPGTAANDIAFYNGTVYYPTSIYLTDSSISTNASILNLQVTNSTAIFSGAGSGIGLWNVGTGKFFGILAEL